MSGVVAVGAAVAATAFAASTVATVGLTIGAAFAVTAAVGATLGAVGYFTKVKELQYAGAALGAVGMIGGVATAAGLFGAGSGLFSGASEAVSAGSQIAGTGAEAAQAASAGWANVAPAAISAAPTAGYESVGALMEGQGIVAGEVPGFDAISMVNGTPQVATGEVATALAPDVTPMPAADSLGGTFAEGSPGVPADNINAPYESLTAGFDQWANGGQTPPPPVSSVPDTTPQSLLNGGPIDGAPPKDAFGNIIPQGGDPVGSQIGLGTTNPADPTAIQNNPVAGAPQSSGIAGGDAGVGGAQAATASPAEFASGVSGKTGNVTAPQSAWDSIFNWVQKNQTLSYGALQTFGSFVSGVLKKDASPEVAAELESRRQQNEAATALYEQQQELLQRRLNNMSQPMPVASRMPSLINGVTGRVG